MAKNSKLYMIRFKNHFNDNVLIEAHTRLEAINKLASISEKRKEDLNGYDFEIITVKDKIEK